MRTVRKFLVDVRDALPARLQRTRRMIFAVQQPHAPLIGLEHARENIHQRALARAVLADQRVHLARTHIEINSSQGTGSSEALPDSVEFEQDHEV